MNKRFAIFTALTVFAGCAIAQPTGLGPRGYAVSPDGRVVMSGQGECVRSGQWAPADAFEPCDPVARAVVAPPLPIAEALAAEPAPAPAPSAQPTLQAAPVIQKLTLTADVLFAFNKAELTDAGKRKLDELAAAIENAEVEEIAAVGHADRIASTAYNQKLSEERAQAVKRYFEEKGAKAQRLTAEGKGESAPVTGASCSHLGPERGSNKELVACLQPDRRVEIEVLGTRQLAGETAPAGTGATEIR